MKNIIFLVAALIALCSASCTSSVKVTQRADTWQAGNGRGAIYDVVVTNAGTCPLTNIGLSLSLPTGATLNNYWNLKATSLYYEVTNFEGSLPSGSSVNAGVSVNFPGEPTGITVNVYGSACPSTCDAPSTPPTSSPPTSSPTTPPSSTSAPTSTPTTPPSSTAAPSTCNIGASLRLGSSWTTDGIAYASYHLFLTNNGACDLIDYATSFALNGGEIISSWNLESTRGGYLVKGYGEALHAGDTYGGAGFNVKNAGNIQITPYGSNCRC